MVEPRARAPLVRRVRSWHPRYVHHLRKALAVRVGRALGRLGRRHLLRAAGAPRPYVPFVLVGMPRTGSTMLLDLLHQVPGITVYGEVFNPRDPLARTLRPWDDDEREAADHAGDRPSSWERLLPVRLLRRRVWPSSTLPGVPAVGFKIFWGHCRGVAAPAWVFLSAMPDLRVVHLYREDGLSQAISLERAMRDEVWARRAGTPNPGFGSPVVLDPERLLGHLDVAARARNEIEAFLPPGRSLELSYERLVQDPQGAVDAICDLLAIPSAGVDVRFAPRRTWPLSDEVSNWEQVVAALARTRHAAMVTRHLRGGGAGEGV